MNAATNDQGNLSLIKIVYFDEESASDLLDIVAGGKEASLRESSKERVNEVAADADARAATKFNWLPFFGGSVEAGAAASVSAVGRSILNKTLSNTILTDYLRKCCDLNGIEKLTGLTVTAPLDSAAFMKMFTPYLAILKINELPLNLAELDSALMSAKGYYELIGQDKNGKKRILRFNIQAFRNNYGLVDLGRMHLVFHGIRVGKGSESSLTMEAEMKPNTASRVTALEVVDGIPTEESTFLDVYDIVLAGVEYGE
ncbi:DUF6414 family protein [Gleimia sp. 6138-11-ORH1]|uniref:DUF6414 family protein n=1 Tax=Gleimia sp. 6138-11-ORH1 TaxID=2973937 RepID=UPI00216A92D3|nr:DUF6414 family protein [Gleimia sp. 6138-11-ORH1]MCS4484013.1 DUF6414 family protein [Gleimia sp. 6138-11-ORH1]